MRILYTTEPCGSKCNVTFSLIGNFFRNARGLIFADGGGISWSFNANTNTVTANGSSAGASAGNPTAKVGLAVVNGTAATFMRSDAAPPLDVSITPTWTGAQIWSASVTFNSTVNIGTRTLALSANATVGGTNTGDQLLPAGANPSATLGLAVVNGVATSFMRSDAAPLLSQAITPTWSGLHIFSVGVQGGATALQSGALIGARVAGNDFEFGHSNTAGYGCTLGAETGSGNPFIAFCSEAGTTANTYKTRGNVGRVVKNDAAGGLVTGRVATANADNQSITVDLTVSGTTGTYSFNNAIGWNGATPPAQVTGFGTPVGAAVVASYNSGSSTALQDKQTIAEILTIMKAHGMIGA